MESPVEISEFSFPYEPYPVRLGPLLFTESLRISVGIPFCRGKHGKKYAEPALASDKARSGPAKNKKQTRAESWYCMIARLHTFGRKVLFQSPLRATSLHRRSTPASGCTKSGAERGSRESRGSHHIAYDRRGFDSRYTGAIAYRQER